jgi:hypothetical protein
MNQAHGTFRGRLFSGMRHAVVCAGLAGITYVVAIPSHISFAKGTSGSGSSGGSGSTGSGGTGTGGTGTGGTGSGGGGSVGVGPGSGPITCNVPGNCLCSNSNGSCNPATQPSKNSSGNSGGSTQPSGN